MAIGGLNETWHRAFTSGEGDKNMRAGRLRHRVDLQQLSPTLNAMGEPSETWTTYATVSADVEPISGNERLAVQQAQADTTHRVTMRFRKGLAATHRILHRSRALNITSTRNVSERNRTLLIDCVEQID